ncbi:MAG: glycine--tRNA ligase [Candidatus Micrarchaeota archaeon]|nr:glycine--tRNA ligase [Candidatus Micrarchaeota archaeon]
MKSSETPNPKAERLIDVAIRRSFIIPSAEIYGSPAGFYDYGPVGCAIKHRLENLWRSEMLQKEGFHEIETTCILPEAVFKASGHAENFSDPVVSCKKCNQRFRADHLLAESPGFIASGAKAEGMQPQELADAIRKYKVACPNDLGELTDVTRFNMMFKTAIGAGEERVAYCRPETAQGIFLDFARIVRNYGSRLPIGIGQVGRSFRNEISPRQGIVRVREFSQMELEYFFNPKYQTHPKFESVKGEKLAFELEDGTVSECTLAETVERGIVPNQIMAYFLWKQERLYIAAGVPRDKFRFRKIPKNDTPHYSRGNIDLVVDTSYGWIETVGTAYRTDYDLSSHAKASGTDLSVFVEEEKKKVVPHVVEPSMGVERMFWCVLEHCFREKSPEKDWEWFDFPPSIAPYHAWVFPLMRKDGMEEKAREVEALLRESGLIVYCQESGSIGKRYARADEIGVPYCITVDYDTMKDDTVTLRFRNDGKQARLKIGELAGKIAALAKEGKVNADFA